MDWLLNLVILWFGVSVLVIATGWYATKLIPWFWPNWWQRVVVDVEPSPPIFPKEKSIGLITLTEKDSS